MISQGKHKREETFPTGQVSLNMTLTFSIVQLNSRIC